MTEETKEKYINKHSLEGNAYLDDAHVVLNRNMIITFYSIILYKAVWIR